MDKVLEDRLHIAIGYRLISYIAGYNVSNEWGSSLGSDGFKEAERIVKLNYRDIQLKNIYDEILREFLFRSVIEIQKQNKTEMTMKDVIGENNETAKKSYIDSQETYRVYKEDTVLNERLKSISDNKRIIESKKIIDEFWIDLLNGEEDKISTIENVRKLMESLDIIEKQKNDSKYDNIDLDLFLDRTLNEAMGYIDSNTFKKSEINESEKNIVRQLFEAKINTVGSSNIRARVKDTIFDKINKGKINSLSLYDFQDGLLEMIDMYRNAIEGKKDKKNIYIIEKQYNLTLYVIIASEIIGLGIKDSKISEFLKQIQDILIYVDCLDGYKDINNLINKRYDETEEGIKIVDSPLIKSLDYKYRIKEKVIRNMPKIYNNTINLADIEETELIDDIILDNMNVLFKKLISFESMLLEKSVEGNKISKIVKKIMNNHKEILKLRENKIKDIIEI